MNQVKANVSRFWLGLLALLLSLSLLVVLLPPAAAAVPANSVGEPLGFEYQGDYTGWWASRNFNPANTTGKVVTGDFNGDGLDEVAALYDLGGDSARWIVWISSRIGFNGGDLSDPWWTSAVGEYTAGATSWRVVAGDFNGDGRDDVAAMYDYGNETRWHVWLSTGTSFTYQGNPGWWSDSEYTAGNATFRVVAGDFDGDGLDDVAAMYDYGNDLTRWHVWLSTGTTFDYQGSNAGAWWSSSQYTAGDARARVVAGDFDGDGRDEVAAMYDYGNDLARWHVWLSTGTSFTYQGNTGWWSNSEYTATATTGRVVAEDFDGDGRDDVAAMYDYGNETRWHVWLSTGTSFTYQGNTGWWSGSQYTAADTTGRVVAGDYDGDSIADVAAMHDYEDVATMPLAAWHVWLSNAPNRILLPLIQR